jgi:TolB-like protein/tetratricopeptide (TPR) repeat protein
MPDIFLSYTREDQATAQRFAEEFEAQGFSVWWDVTLRSGETYDQVTEEALRTANAVVVLWSQKSVVSRWVRAEATLADRHRTLVPARIEACDLPIMFELTQTADLSGWTGQPSDPAWRAFLADVRRFIEASAAAPPPPAPQPLAQAAPTALPSIAVLPFINRSGLPADDDFAEAMVEDLTAALSVNPMRKVVAASATTFYRKGGRDLRQIGRDLGVLYLLEGNVRRVGEDLRVTAQLVEAESGSILWTQRFDRPIAQLSALQDDLVTEVAAHLGVQMGLAAMEHARKKPGNISAFEAALRAQAHFTDGTRAGWEAAVAEAKRAVQIDPSYGPAYGALLVAQSRLFPYLGGDDRELLREIADNVRRARAVDPNNLVVLFGTVSALAALGKLEDALPLAERAIAMNPNAENSHLSLGSVLARLGRWDEALAELDAAERLGPNSNFRHLSSIWRSVALLQTGRLEPALEAAERAFRRLPGTESLLQNILCLTRLNRRDRARVALRRLRDMDPEVSCATLENLVRYYFYSGSNAVDEYVAIVREVWDEASSEPKSP